MLRILFLALLLSSSAFSQSDIPDYQELYLYSQLSEIKSKLGNNITTRSLGSTIFKTNAPKTAIVLTPGGIGSGALISDDGLVVTNFHVISKENIIDPVIMVGFCTSEKYDPNASDAIFKAEVVSYIKEKDLALLRLEKKYNANPYLIETNMQNVSIGDDVHAIGNPRAEKCSYTRGYISQIRDKYEWLEHKANIIQTQTPINPGNSGGPLISNEGKIIGINSFILPNSPGLNYAVSADEVLSFIKNPPSIPKLAKTNNCEYAEEGKIEELDSYIIRKWDKDCDQYFERRDIDYNKDGYYDEYYYDRNKNLKNETVIKWVKNKEEWVLQFNYDNDEDGIYEKVCTDLNQNKKQDEGECKII